MSLFRKLRAEFIDIIEWVDDGTDVLVHKFERYNNEIKNGAKLTVRPGQVAILVNQGKLADVYEPGMHTLSTPNMPILSTLMGWKYAFNSPFKVDVFFVNTRTFTDRKWGTRNPIMKRDAEFGMVRLRAFGNYSFRVAKAGKFLENFVGAVPKFQASDITDQIRNIIVTRFSDAMGESSIPVLDKAAKYNEYSGQLQNQVGAELESYGLELTSFLIENISLPPEVEAVLDKRTGMGIVGDMQKFAQFQAAQAMEKAAENEGGGAGAGLGMGMGFMMAQQSMNPQNQGQNSPPPLPGNQWHVAINGAQQGPFDESTIQNLVNQGQITRESLIWKTGMSNWTQAGEVSDFQRFFGNTPPPLPLP
jgi:membrane protease subunit (stomatin/prohibitin family)